MLQGMKCFLGNCRHFLGTENLSLRDVIKGKRVLTRNTSDLTTRKSRQQGILFLNTFLRPLFCMLCIGT